MMKHFLLILMISHIFMASAEARTQYQIEINSNEGQLERWQNGVQFVDSSSQEAVVRIINIQDELPDDQSTFRVIVLNKSNEPITIGPENVSIQYGDGDTIAMLTYEELSGRLRRDLGRRSALAALGHAFSAQAANGYTTGSVDFSGTTSDGSRFSGSGTYSGYDPALAQQQQSAVREQARTVNEALQVRRLNGSQALQNLLRTSTISAGEIFGGLIAYDAPRAFRRIAGRESITIIVKVNGQEHRFSASISKL